MTFFYNLNKKLDEIRATPSTTHTQLNERDMGKHNNATTGFKAVADKAAKQYGSKAAGERVAGAVKAKMAKAGKLEEADMDESAFQAAIGKKKYGEEGMKALQKAGRDHASAKTMSNIRNKYDKYDQGVDEGLGDVVKKVGSMAKKVGGAVLDKLGHGSDEDMIRDLQKKAGVPQTGKKPQQPNEGVDKQAFAALAPPKDKITFADKIAGAKKEVDEMLGDVAAEAIKSALTPKQKKLDKNNNGKLDANDFAMLRKGGKKMADESRDDDEDDVYSYQDPSKKKTHKTASGGTVTRHGGITRHQAAPGHYGGYDPETDPDKDDDKPEKPAGEKRGRGRPKGPAKGPERVTAKATKHKGGRKVKEGDFGPMEESSELKAAMALLKKAGYKVSKAEQELDEKAVSKKQQKFMGMVHATQKGEKAPSKEVAKVAKTMKKSDAEDFASTKHKGLPEKAPKKKEKTEEAGGTGTPTASSGFGYGKGIYDSINHELESMIAESMNISMNMSNDAHGGPNKSLTVTATDDDAMKLSDLLKNAGLGGGDHPNVEGGSEVEVHGAEDLADQIRQAVDGEHGEGETCDACGSADCGCEEVDEAAVSVSDNQPDYPTNTETNDDALQYSGGLNKPKSTGQTTIPVIAGQDERTKGYGDGFDEVYEDDITRLREMAGIKEAKKVEEDDVEEGNKFTGNLAKARADGKKEADLDGDGDLEKVRESVNNLWKQYKVNHGV